VRREVGLPHLLQHQRDLRHPDWWNMWERWQPVRPLRGPDEFLPGDRPVFPGDVPRHGRRRLEVLLWTGAGLDELAHVHQRHR
jgi:hypothetical protein